MVSFLIFLFFIVFPFGQLFKFGPINFIDVIVFLIVLFSFRKLDFKKIIFGNFIVVCVFSLFFSVSFFTLPSISTGVLYLVRFIIYLFFMNLIGQRYKDKKKLFIESLIIVGVFVALFGFIQYLVFPDFRALETFGWDPHYYRLASTFFDTTFTGIILVLSEVLILVKYFQKRNRRLFLASLVVISAIALTFSRSSYLSLVFVFGFLFWKFREKVIFLFGLFFMVCVFVAPKPAGEGVNLTRTSTINAKFVNYNESEVLLTKSPVLGIGFNNTCIARLEFLGDEKISSHVCGGR